MESYDGSCEASELMLNALQQLRSRRTKELSSFKPRAISRTALLAASITPPAVDVLETICSNIADGDGPDIPSFAVSDVCMLCWALTAANHRHVPALKNIGECIAEQASDFTALEISRLLIAFSELRVSPHGLLEHLSLEIMWKIDQFTTVGLAEVLNACAQLEYCKEPMFDWIAVRVIARLSEFSSEDLATVMESYALASIKHEVLAQSIAAEAAKRSFTDLSEADARRLIDAFDVLGINAYGVSSPLYHHSLTSPDIHLQVA